MMNKNILLVLGGFFTILFFLIVLVPPSSNTAYSQAFYYTPTPQSDGRIVYIVKANDTCQSIALKNNIDIQVLRELNNLTFSTERDECQFIREGQELLIGVLQASTPTPTSPVPLEPSPTPFKGNGTICIFLFNDSNGNALAEETEIGLGGGQVSITDPLSRVNLTGATIEGTAEGSEALCFEDIPEGQYSISVAIPEGYNPTTVLNFTLDLGAGDSSTIDFGAQPSSRLRPPLSGDGSPSPLLAVLGLFFIAAGVGLWFYLRKISRA